MYYELTKEEYKKKEKQFRKTYVGKLSYMKCMAMVGISAVLLVAFLLLPVLGEPSAAGIEDIMMIILIATCINCELHMGLNYKNELKGYILSQKK